MVVLAVQVVVEKVVNIQVEQIFKMELLIQAVEVEAQVMITADLVL
jgi:hypothetical protein